MQRPFLLTELLKVEPFGWIALYVLDFAYCNGIIIMRLFKAKLLAMRRRLRSVGDVGIRVFQKRPAAERVHERRLLVLSDLLVLEHPFVEDATGLVCLVRMAF